MLAIDATFHVQANRFEHPERPGRSLHRRRERRTNSAFPSICRSNNRFRTPYSSLRRNLI
jgi:hypothetical protein